MEYASGVWDNCGQAHCNHLEQIQIEAARIVTGLSIYACQIVVLPSTVFEPTPLIHCSTIRLAFRPALYATRPHPLPKKNDLQ